jgi:hypothetical protein
LKQNAQCLLAVAAALLVTSTACASATRDGDEAAIAACFEAMDRAPELQPVNKKFARRNPTAEQLADTSVASEAEADMLRLRIVKTRPCRELRLDAVRRHDPLLEPAYKTLYYQADQVFEYLSEGWITFGEANSLARLALLAFEARQSAYVAAASDAARRELSEAWSEQLQRAHSNPPPDGLVTCAWEDDNLACR